MTYLCYNELRSPLSFLSAFFNEECVFLSTLIVCSCLVVACCKVIPRTLYTSLITWDTKANQRLEVIIVGRHACLVMMLIMATVYSGNCLASCLVLG